MDSSLRALNRSLPGGNWDERNAISIPNLSHNHLRLQEDTHSILIFVDCPVDVLYNITALTDDELSGTNSQKLNALANYQIVIPDNIATEPIIHFKQTISNASGKIRIIER